MIDISTTAARLAQLGCTPAQIERHIANLTALARQQTPPPTPKLSLIDAETAALITDRMRQQVAGGPVRRYLCARGLWAGTIVAEVLGLDVTTCKGRAFAKRVVADLVASGHLKVLTEEAGSVQRHYVEPAARVQPPPPPSNGRIRLHDRPIATGNGADPPAPPATPPRTAGNGTRNAVRGVGAP